MRPTGPSLPPDVLAALDDGKLIEAIKRLRAATGLGLKEAKDLVDAHLAGDDVSMPTRAASPSAAPTLSPHHAADSVRQALANGNKIEAIRLLRDHEGLGLKEAKDRVDAMEQTLAEPSYMGMGTRTGPSQLSPGQQPTGGAGLWVVAGLVAVIGVAAYLWMRSGA